MTLGAPDCWDIRLPCDGTFFVRNISASCPTPGPAVNPFAVNKGANLWVLCELRKPPHGLWKCGGFDVEFENYLSQRNENDFFFLLFSFSPVNP
jgi:hypothetical protein